MIGDGQHEAEDKGFGLIFIVLEVADQLVEFSFLIFSDYQIFVLELPSVGVQFELFVISENFKVLEVLQAEFVVATFEVSEEDVLVSPGPVLSQFVVGLDFEQELLHSSLELPERGATQYVVAGGASLEQVQEAESVEGGVVAAEVRGVLLMAFALIYVEMFIVLMRDEIGYGFFRYKHV